MTFGKDFGLGTDVCCKGAWDEWGLVDEMIADEEEVGRGGFCVFTTGLVVWTAPGAGAFCWEDVGAKLGSYLCRINAEFRGLDASS